MVSKKRKLWEGNSINVLGVVIHVLRRLRSWTEKRISGILLGNKVCGRFATIRSTSGHARREDKLSEGRFSYKTYDSEIS